MYGFRFEMRTQKSCRGTSRVSVPSGKSNRKREGLAPRALHTPAIISNKEEYKYKSSWRIRDTGICCIYCLFINRWSFNVSPNCFLFKVSTGTQSQWRGLMTSLNASGGVKKKNHLLFIIKRKLFVFFKTLCIMRRSVLHIMIYLFIIIYLLCTLTVCESCCSAVSSGIHRETTAKLQQLSNARE